MKTKEYVMSAFDRGVNLIDVLGADIQDTRNDLDLSDKGKQKRIAQMKEQWGRRIDESMQNAAGFVGSRRKDLIRNKQMDGEKACGVAHQMQLANAIKTLEMCGGRMTRQEIENLIDPLKFDVNAKWPILTALDSAGVTGFTGAWKEEMFAHHAQRDRQIEELEKLETKLSGLWNLAAEYDDMNAFEIQIAIANIKDKLGNFDEDLVYQG